MSNDRGDPDLLARRIASGLARLSLAIKAQSWRGSAVDGITPTQGEVLARLAEHPVGLRLGELARQLDVSAPTTSAVVAVLVAKGLAASKQGADRRAVRLRVTRKGKAVAARAADWTGFLTNSIATLPVSEQAAFLSSLVKIIRAMQEQGDMPVQRMCVTCEHFRPFAHSDSANPHHCNFVDAAFGQPALRLNCADHLPADRDGQANAWAHFVSDGAQGQMT
jgi:DNA-binding MarR family transcriptional regulator